MHTHTHTTYTQPVSTSDSQHLLTVCLCVSCVSGGSGEHQVPRAGRAGAAPRHPPVPPRLQAQRQARVHGRHQAARPPRHAAGNEFESNRRLRTDSPYTSALREESRSHGRRLPKLTKHDSLLAPITLLQGLLGLPHRRYIAPVAWQRMSLTVPIRTLRRFHATGRWHTRYWLWS